MARPSKTLILSAAALVFVTLAVAQEYCGSREPTADRLCVSLRLPWQFEPIYFCTDKGKINYRQRCKSSGLYCAPPSDNTLQVSTPWDCCPISSQPDPCGNAKCRPAPFNRTCTEYYTDNYWDCCPRYYCDSGSRDMCHIKKLEPGCLAPTKEKENCTGFVDPFGCCNKYQCREDEKPGECPPPLKSQGFPGDRMPVVRFGGGANSSGSSGENERVRERDRASQSMFPPASYSVVSFGTLQQCVGDYTCPNRMKCCSAGDQPLTFEEPVLRPAPPGRHSQYHFRSKFSVVHGYCMEPVMPPRT